MSRTTRSVATLAVAGILTTLAPLIHALPAQAAKPKVIKIADASIVEGDTGTKSLSFRVTWTGPKGGAVSVSYATADGTATAGSDYTAKSGTVSLPNGCKCGTISIPIIGDLVTEGTENFYVNLSAPVNATIGDAQAVGTIYDNEGPPAFVVLDASATESAGPVAFSVIMTNASASTQTVDYATSDGTATAGADYTAMSGTLTFTAGQTSKTVNVPILNDTLNEADETFSLTLSNSTLTLNDSTATGTIFDDDAEPTISVTDASAPEGSGLLAFTISISAVSGQEVDVDYTTTDGTALAGSDYTATSGTAIIPAGSTSVEVDVPVTDDQVYENDEGLTLDLSSPVNASILDTQGAGTITNDDPLPSASIADVSVAEGSSGTAPAGFTVTLSNPSAFTATVDWATSDGTATAGSDYTAGSGTVTFNPGETSKPVSIDVLGDTTHESDETFAVTLLNPTGSTIGTATATGTITNDDPLPSASIADVSVVEGSSGTTPADFTVTLSNPSDSTVTVDWATSDGTATAGSDYTAGSGTVTFNPGETSKPVSVDVLGDTTFELDETFTVTLSNPTKSTIGTATATGTITNDDAKAATTLTIKVSKTRRTVSASGVLELATPLATVKVTISRKRSGHWVTLASKTVGVKNLGDRDGDGIPDASYKASFPRPKRGSYRLRATFAGNATLLPSSSKALTIKI